ncbi:MAG: hypothetical protein ACP5H7_01095 [Minisyncoccia bacterium]
MEYIRQLRALNDLQEEKEDIMQTVLEELEKKKEYLFDLIEAEKNFGLKISRETLINLVEEAIKDLEVKIEIIRVNPYFKKLNGVKNRLIFEALKVASKGRRINLFLIFDDLINNLGNLRRQ